MTHFSSISHARIDHNTEKVHNGCSWKNSLLIVSKIHFSLPFCALSLWKSKRVISESARHTCETYKFISPTKQESSRMKIRGLQAGGVPEIKLRSCHRRRRVFTKYHQWCSQEGHVDTCPQIKLQKKERKEVEQKSGQERKAKCKHGKGSVNIPY